MKIYLGSKSPRRKELLQSLGYDFEVVDILCDENYPENLPAHKVAGYLSEEKAKNFRELENDEVLITADTIVAIDEKILGKPKNNDEAKEMLRFLSGKIHQVYTAISLRTFDQIFTQTDKAEVEVSVISEEEIDFYIKNFQPLDKAGAYGVQEWLGMAKITKINGSFYTIMGLPTALVYQFLKEMK
ncbi:MAG: Maf family protein [Flavobacteriaceae bacterium]|nr:Maf family protein [Flavobacteriaceae bacterium]